MHSRATAKTSSAAYEDTGIGLAVGALEGYARRPRLDPGVRQPRLLSDVSELDPHAWVKLRHSAA